MSSTTAPGVASIGQSMIAGMNRDPISFAQQVDSLQKWFGPPRGDIRVGAHDKLAVVTDTLPDAFKGRSLYMRDTVDGLVMTNGEWYTTIALPWAYTPEQHFTFSEWKFNLTLAGQVPHEGVPRLVTSQRRTFRRHTVRRGLAFVLEHDFWRTEQGQEMYARNMMGLKLCIQETLNYDVAYEISTARNYIKTWQREKGMLNVPAHKLVQLETMYTGIVNKSAKGFDFLMARMLKTLSQIGVQPDMLIAPPDLQLYYAHLDPQKTTYWLFGPDGILTLKQGPDAAARIGNINVFVQRFMDISETEPPVNPFLQQVSWGERYVMRNQYSGDDPRGFSMQWMNTVLFDQSHGGNFFKLRFQDAFAHAMRFDKTGRLRPEHKLLADKTAREPRSSFLNKYPGYNPLLSGRGQLLSEPNQKHYRDGFRDVFLFRDSTERFQLVTRFGQMELNAATKQQFREIAETAANNAFPHGHTEELRDLAALMMLIDQSERVEYNEWFMYYMIMQNMPRQLNATNQFDGTATAADVTGTRGLPAVKEMRPNRFGGLDLPSRSAHPSFATMAIPPFVNSWGMIQTLAAERDGGKGWDDAAGIAYRGVQVINAMMATMKKSMASSAFVRAVNRPPWLSQADSEATFVAEVLVGPRDAVWLRIPYGVRAVASGVPKRRAATTSATTNAVIPSRNELITEIIGSDNAVAVAYQYIYDNMESYAVDSTDAAEVALMRDQFSRIVLAVITNTLRNQVELDPTQCSQAQCRGRKFVRALFATVSDAASGPASFRTMLTRLQPLISAETTPSATSTANRALNNIMKMRTPSINVVAGVPVVDSSAIVDDLADRDAEGPVNLAPFKSLAITGGAQAENRNFNDIVEAKTQLDAAFARLRPRLSPAVLGAGDRRQVMAATNALVTQAEAVAAGAGATATFAADADANAALEQYKATYLRMTDLLDAGPAIIDDYAGDSGAAGDEQGTTSIPLTNDAWDGGVWVRAPLNSSLAFATTSIGLSRPLALPSDPTKAHLSPVILIDDNSSETLKLQQLLERPQYQSRATETKHRDLGATSWMESMVEVQVPQDVWQRSAPSAVQAALNRRTAAVAAASSPASSSSSAPMTAASAGSRKRSLADIMGGGERSAQGDYSTGNPLVGLLASPQMGVSARTRARPAGGATYVGFTPSYELSDGQPRDQRADYDEWDAVHKMSPSTDPYGQSLGQGHERLPDVAAGYKQGFDMVYSGARREMEVNTFIYRWKQGNEIPDLIVRSFHQVFLGCLNIEKQWNQLMDNNIQPPCSLLIWRLFITHKMYQIPLMVGGYSTGATFYGNSNVILGDDIISKLHYANVTFNSVAAVFEAKNVAITENAMYSEYVGGNGQIYVTDPSQVDWSGNAPETDIIVTLIPMNEDLFPDPMDFSGRFQLPDANPRFMTETENTLHYSSALYYNQVYKTEEALERASRPENDFYGAAGRSLPQTMALWGFQAFYDRTSGRYATFHQNALGHSGPKAVGAQAALVMNGADMMFAETPEIPLLT